jgi:hypothetical protein
MKFWLASYLIVVPKIHKGMFHKFKMSKIEKKYI